MMPRKCVPYRACRILDELIQYLDLTGPSRALSGWIIISIALFMGKRRERNKNNNMPVQDVTVTQCAVKPSMLSMIGVYNLYGIVCMTVIDM